MSEVIYCEGKTVEQASEIARKLSHHHINILATRATRKMYEGMKNAVECAHGILPVPAPATAELVKGIPIYSTAVLGELLTPTGAAILTTLSSGFGPLPKMTIKQIGYGAGSSDPEIPNLLRVFIGEARNEEVCDLEEAVLIEPL